MKIKQKMRKLRSVEHNLFLIVRKGHQKTAELCMILNAQLVRRSMMLKMKLRAATRFMRPEIVKLCSQVGYFNKIILPITFNC